MSIGWGFAAGIGQGAYSVADDRIKDSMLQRRELRAREAQMELEQYRTKARREERTEERSYLEGQSEIEHGRTMEKQELVGQQAMERAQLKVKPGSTGAKKQWGPLTERLNEDGSVSYIQQNQVTGEVKEAEIGGVGGGQKSQADLQAEYDRFYDAYLPNRTWPNSDENLHAAADALGLPRKPNGEPYSEDRIEHEWYKRNGVLPEGASQAAPTDIGSAPVAQPSGKDADEASAAMRDPQAMWEYMMARGAPEDRAKKAIRDTHPNAVQGTGGKWTLAETPAETTAAPRGKRFQQAKAGREAEAKQWAESLTEEVARERYKTRAEFNADLRRHKDFLEEKGTLWNKVHGLGRKLFRGRKRRGPR